MEIKQFEHKPLSHFSYAIISDGKMAVVDPERDPMKYYAFAKANNATIIAIIETHPHADFVSAHLQMHEETGATIYCSKKTGADYPHQAFDDGDSFMLGNATLKAVNTPGHSPDSITIAAIDGKSTALFTGDTLFIGDVGRPDLREKAGNMTAKRQELAAMMYDTMQHKYSDFPDDAIVYPAHGAGSLCGKGMSDASSSTLGDERANNWAFKKQSKEEFVNVLLDGQPFIPSYFGYDVDMNKTGAENVRTSAAKIPLHINTTASGLIVDVREEASFKQKHLEGSFNIRAASDTSKFETWLGAIIKPNEKFTLVIDTPEDLEKILQRAAKIGYEKNVSKVITLKSTGLETTPALDLEDFKNHPGNYTIVDIRNQSEIDQGKFFESALAHPLNELRTTAQEIPRDKPIVVHCAGGYRSAAGSSILQDKFNSATVYDLSDDIEKFK